LLANLLFCEINYNNFWASLLFKTVKLQVKNISANNIQNRYKAGVKELYTRILCVIKNKQTWLCSFNISFLNLPILILASLWGNIYLVQAKNLIPATASYIITMLFLGTVIGSPLLGWLSDRFKCSKTLLILNSFLSCITIALIIFVANASVTLLMLFFLLGIFTSSQTLNYPIIASNNQEDNIGTAIGLASVVIMSSAAIMQPLFGKILELNWKGTTINNIPVYTVGELKYAMLSLLTLMLFSVILSFFLKNKVI